MATISNLNRFVPRPEGQSKNASSVASKSNLTSGQSLNLLLSLAWRSLCLTGVAFLLSVLAACSENGGIAPADGGGGALSGSPSDGSVAESPLFEDSGSDVLPPTPNGAVNGPLTGRLLTVGDIPHRNALLALDLETGRYAPIDGADTPTIIDSVSGEDAARYFTADDSEPGRFVETNYNCAGGAGVRCIGLWSASAVLESAFAVSDPEQSLPGTSIGKRSRDGRFVAFTNRDTEVLEVRTVSGELVSSAEYIRQLGSPYDWLPDGSILIQHDTDGDIFDGLVRFTRTVPNSAVAASSLTLPERYEGRVQHIVVDPSGSRVAMLARLTGNGGNRRPIVLDLNTNLISEPVAPGDAADNIDARGIHWSPDGQWLIFQDPTFQALLTPIPIGPAPGQGLPRNVTYAIRADGGSYPLPNSVGESNNNARVVLARPRDDPNGAPMADDAAPGFVWLQ